MHTIVILDKSLKTCSTFSVGLKGFSRDSIVFDGNTKNWMIVDQQFSGSNMQLKDNFDILGTKSIEKSGSMIPTGLHQWTLVDRSCNETRTLKLSSVSRYIEYKLFDSDLISLSVMMSNLLVMMEHVLIWISAVTDCLIAKIKVMKTIARLSK